MSLTSPIYFILPLQQDYLRAYGKKFYQIKSQIQAAQANNGNGGAQMATSDGVNSNSGNDYTNSPQVSHTGLPNQTSPQQQQATLQNQAQVASPQASAQQNLQGLVNQQAQLNMQAHTSPQQAQANLQSPRVNLMNLNAGGGLPQQARPQVNAQGRPLQANTASDMARKHALASMLKNINPSNLSPAQIAILKQRLAAGQFNPTGQASQTQIPGTGQNPVNIAADNNILQQAQAAQAAQAAQQNQQQSPQLTRLGQMAMLNPQVMLQKQMLQRQQKQHIQQQLQQQAQQQHLQQQAQQLQQSVNQSQARPQNSQMPLGARPSNINQQSDSRAQNIIDVSSSPNIPAVEVGGGAKPMTPLQHGAAVNTVAGISRQLLAGRVKTSPIEGLTDEEKRQIREQMEQMTPMFQKLDQLLPLFFHLTSSPEATKRLMMMKLLFQDQLDALPKGQYVISPTNLKKLREQFQRYFMFVRTQMAAASNAPQTNAQSLGTNPAIPGQNARPQATQPTAPIAINNADSSAAQSDPNSLKHPLTTADLRLPPTKRKSPQIPSGAFPGTQGAGSVRPQGPNDIAMRPDLQGKTPQAIAMAQQRQQLQRLQQQQKILQAQKMQQGQMQSSLALQNATNVQKEAQEEPAPVEIDPLNYVTSILDNLKSDSEFPHIIKNALSSVVARRSGMDLFDPYIGGWSEERSKPDTDSKDVDEKYSQISSTWTKTLSV
ncbi:mediator complex subunit, variant 2 [Basidiobolus ranarum]|uniref:Mediator complex subunit, variant 2 n=1 Tax=Basidiobolus ranarum TaxID=34480 RepID=A0ABR2WAX6_9FUNG